MNDEYAKMAVLESQIEELRKELTQTKIALDIARDGNSHNVSVILDTITSVLADQETNLSNYINRFMTQEERDRHGDNIMGYLCSPSGISSTININLMAR